jgi:hypothetical protein
MAEAYYTIPLKPEPQSFGITLAGKEYRLTVRWFDAPEQADPAGPRSGASGDSLPAQQDISGTWTLDIEEPEKAAPIVMGIPLVTGCDLLEQYSYLEFSGELWVEGELPPTLENLGSEVELVFIVQEVSA